MSAAENVYFQAQIGVCTEFIQDGKKQQASVVISPLKVVSGQKVGVSGEPDDTIRVNSGCNLWKACKNRACSFAMISHPAQS